MGFLHGIARIGEYYNQQDQDGKLGEIHNFLEYPLDLPDKNTPDDRVPMIIQVGLWVEDPTANPLKVKGIHQITTAQYPTFTGEEIKDRYLYRAPVGANVSWSFSPILKLGKGAGEGARSELISNPKDPTALEQWEKNKDSRFFKLYNRVLKGFEEAGSFAEGSADCIMQAMVDRVDELAEKWQDKKRSYLLVFGVIDTQEKFLFPGDVPAFQAYFMKRMGIGKDESSEQKGEEICCSLCHSLTKEYKTLNSVFKFATFDKENFLPGLDKNGENKVFPVCNRCYTLLSRGKTEVENRFGLDIGIQNLKVLIVPELIGDQHYIKRLTSAAAGYLQNSVDTEFNLQENIIKREASFVYHLLFIEKNQAQIILHRLVEDIPPTQFKKIKELWDEKEKIFNPSSQPSTLNQIIKRIVAQVLSLSGKSEIDKLVMKDNALTIIASLLGNEWIDVDSLKQAVVLRLPGLFSNDEWLNDKTFNGGTKLNQLHFLFEFLHAFDQVIDPQEILNP